MRAASMAALSAVLLCSSLSETGVRVFQHPGTSEEFSFDNVIEALGGKDKILAITGLRVHLLYSSYAVERFAPEAEKDIGWWDRRIKSQRRRAEEAAAKQSPEEAEAIKRLPLPDPTKYFATLERRHIHLHVDLPDRARSVILTLGTPLTKDVWLQKGGEDVGLDVIDVDGSGWHAIRNQGRATPEHRPIRGAGDLSYALPLLGMLRSILLAGNYTADFSVSETIGGIPIRVFRLDVATGPYAGEWSVKVHGRTRLPVSLEYRRGLPPLFLGADGYIFSTSIVQPKTRAKDAPRGYWPRVAAVDRGLDRPDMDDVLGKYGEQVRFAQSFGAYQQIDGIACPTLAKTTVVLRRTKKFTSEWHSAFAIMSLDWNPVGPRTDLWKGLKDPPGTQRTPSRAGGTTVPGMLVVEPGISRLEEIRRFYAQLVWNAIFTPAQFNGDCLRSAPYVVISPGWAKFYDIRVAFPEDGPLSTDGFCRIIRSHRDLIMDALKGKADEADLPSLEKAFGDLESVAKQGLTMYDWALAIRWTRCFDAQNLAVGSARVVREMDRLAELLGLSAQTAESLLARTGIDTAALAATGIDLRRNAAGDISLARRIGTIAAFFLVPVPTFVVAGVLPRNPWGTRLAEAPALRLEETEVWGSWASREKAIPRELFAFEQSDARGVGGGELVPLYVRRDRLLR